VHLELVPLRALVSLGERGIGERKVGFEVESELQEDDPHVEAAFAGERVTDAEEDFGEPLCRGDHQKRRGLALFDFGKQRFGKGMAR